MEEAVSNASIAREIRRQEAEDAEFKKIVVDSVRMHNFTGPRLKQITWGLARKLDREEVQERTKLEQKQKPPDGLKAKVISVVKGWRS